jgi:hypothetical protein
MFTDPDIQLHADKIRDDGYTVIERAAEADLVEGLKQALERIEREHGFGYAKTSFEGFKTVRINNLLTYDDIFREAPLHDNVLPIVERLLDKECLLSSFCSLVLGPGQEAQPIHEDTQLIPLPRPHIPIAINAIWALSDFTRITVRRGSCRAATNTLPRRNTARHTTPPPQRCLRGVSCYSTARSGMAAAPIPAMPGVLRSPAPIAGAGCGSRKTSNSVFR